MSDISSAAVGRYIALWQPRLGLAHWRIETRVGEVENGPETILEVQRHENAHRAVVTIPEWLDSGDVPSDFQETIDDRFLEQAVVHDLCHLLFRDVVFVIRDDVAELFGQVAHELVMRQLGRHEEATVDLLSRALVETWPTDD